VSSNFSSTQITQNEHPIVGDVIYYILATFAQRGIDEAHLRLVYQEYDDPALYSGLVDLESFQEARIS